MGRLQMYYLSWIVFSIDVLLSLVIWAGQIGSQAGQIGFPWTSLPIPEREFFRLPGAGA